MSELTEQNLTRQQAEQEMACLRKIYASVRLLDPKMLAEEPCLAAPSIRSRPAMSRWTASPM